MYLWFVVPSEGLEVNSRNGKLQRRRPVSQWISGQDKDVAGMGHNGSWREVPINIGWVFEPLSWLIHVLPHLQAENACRDWWWRWSRWWNRRQVGVRFYLKLDIIGGGVEWHSTAADTWGVKRLGPRPWGDGEQWRKAALEFSGLFWLMLEKYSDGAWSRPFGVRGTPAYEQWGQMLYISALKHPR